MGNKEKGITLIALVITIIVLLILAGVAISTLTGDNGVLTKAVSSREKTDIAETKEQIKLEIMGNLNDEGKYTNTDVVKAVYKITGKQIEENVDSVQTSKGNDVDLSDLWVAEEEKVTFTVNGREITLIGEELYIDDWYEEPVRRRKSFTDWLVETNDGFSWKNTGGGVYKFFYVPDFEVVNLIRNGESLDLTWLVGTEKEDTNNVLANGDVWLIKNSEGELFDIWGENNK